MTERCASQGFLKLSVLCPHIFFPLPSADNKIANQTPQQLMFTDFIIRLMVRVLYKHFAAISIQNYKPSFRMHSRNQQTEDHLRSLQSLWENFLAFIMRLQCLGFNSMLKYYIIFCSIFCNNCLFSNTTTILLDLKICSSVYPPARECSLLYVSTN